MAKRGKAKQDEVRVEGFRSGLDFGKARALHLLRMMNEGFEDAIKDDELWHEVKLKEGENEMKAKQATAELQAKTVQFCIKYVLEAWDQPGEDESPANMTDDEDFLHNEAFVADQAREERKRDDNIVKFKDKDDDS